MTTVFNHERETPRSSSHDIRVVLADDHQLFRQGLKALLELERGITIVGEASDGLEVTLVGEAVRVTALWAGSIRAGVVALPGRGIFDAAVGRCLRAGGWVTVSLAFLSVNFVVDRVLAESPQAVADFKRGKTKAADAIKGAVMRETKGMAKTDLVQKLLLEELQNA